MSVSTDAIIFWGFSLNEENLPDWISGWEDHYTTEVAGIAKPTMEYDDNPEAHRMFWDKGYAVIESSLVTIGRHCSGHYPMYYVCIKSSEVIANRGLPVKLSGLLKVGGLWEITLKQFCESMSIEWQEPDWHLASWIDN